MKVDATIGGLAGATAQARRLERRGYDGLWVGEMNQDPFLPLALAAEATDRIDLGTSIAVAFARSPMTLAYTAADLQQHSGGRMWLGLGSQVKAHVVRRFSMPWGRPAPQMREYVLALRAIWAAWGDGSPLRFEGEYYRHTLMPRDFASPATDLDPPRILVAGVGDAMTRVAGEVADGFLCHGFTTARWIRERTLPALAAGRVRATAAPGGVTSGEAVPDGSVTSGFDIVATPFVVTGSDQQMAQEIPALRERIAFYASTPSYRGLFELHGWEGLSEELTALSKAGRWTEMSRLITDDILAEFAVIAAVHEVPERLAARFGGLLTRMSFRPAGLDPEAAADLAADVRRRCTAAERDAAVGRPV
ncbi:TIGR03617 family F420-dependent LLM class oxidoreductase [Nocardia alni]|uniref:TIGR03617 family F420-dependent LLM class oxidoreductase n=1 Tax=Nocardia alni TaxID=2815723 RepID=UPI001C23E687|nr:TIGR03617 family F420-dependent LLM class oxidoreductase [Nocardia alni]